MSEEKLSNLLHRTAQLHSAIADYLVNLSPVPENRYIVSFQAALLSLEHAKGANILIGHELYASGYSLLRPQFETLVRGIWLLHAANDNWVEKLSKPLTLENVKNANEGLMLAEMLKELDHSSAPTQLIAQLKQCKDVTWKALNSYTHGGLHPLARTIHGYPPQLSVDVLRNSNALVAITVQLAVILSGDSDMHYIRQLHTEFSDCIPVI